MSPFFSYGNKACKTARKRIKRYYKREKIANDRRDAILLRLDKVETWREFRHAV